MHWIHDEKENLERLRKEELERLRKEGFSEQTIARLYQLRKRYAQDEMDRACLDKRHLEFARWLVETGRLTDEIK